jgi:L-threonylcarbamoyladenylate synthase
MLLGTSPADLEKAAEILKNGGLAAFPTETVYGLGADAFNTRALARVFEVKGRPRFDPLIIHIASMDALESIVLLESLSPSRRDLLKKLASSFWPGPLTMILPKRPTVPDLATAGLPTAAVRFPRHGAAQKLITLSTGALAAPSANPFGRLSPTRAEHVLEGLGDKIDCIVDGGPCPVGVESTVLDLGEGQGGSAEHPRILRPGGISREALEGIIGEVAEYEGPAGPGAPSPGMLKNHYAPGTPLFLHSPEIMTALPRRAGEGYLFFSAETRDPWLKQNSLSGTGSGSGEDSTEADTILTLSESGTVLEAAANLFEYLRRLDRLNLRRINSETLPHNGLGAAVNDRLRRASV